MPKADVDQLSDLAIPRKSALLHRPGEVCEDPQALSSFYNYLDNFPMVPLGEQSQNTFFFIFMETFNGDPPKGHLYNKFLSFHFEGMLVWLQGGYRPKELFFHGYLGISLMLLEDIKPHFS